jgi:glycosyltransferase involved in cell wall biosynthesis
MNVEHFDSAAWRNTRNDLGEMSVASRRILIIITKGEVGGAQEFVRSLVEPLRAEGFSVVVGCGQTGSIIEALAHENIPVEHFVNLRRANNPFAVALFALELKRYLDVFPVAIVHLNTSNTLAGALAAKLSRSKPKTCYTFHGLSVLHPSYRAPKVLKYLYFIFFRCFGMFVDCGVFVSQSDFDNPAATGLFKSRRIVMNGIRPPDFLSRSEARAVLSRRIGVCLGDTLLIGSVGRLSYPKNYELLIDAFAQIRQMLPGIKALVVGDGPARQTYEDRAVNRGVANDLLFAGTIPGAAAILRAFDLFVLTSHYEGLPLSLLEAAYAGVPAVAPAVGGIPEILPPSQVYPPGNIEMFVRRCVDTLRDPQAHRPKVQPWMTADAMGRTYANLYGDLLKVM